MDTLTDINVIRRVIEPGGFARAAERLDLSTMGIRRPSERTYAGWAQEISGLPAPDKRAIS